MKKISNTSILPILIKIHLFELGKGRLTEINLFNQLICWNIVTLPFKMFGMGQKVLSLVDAIFSPTSVSRVRESRQFFWRDFTRPRDQDLLHTNVLAIFTHSSAFENQSSFYAITSVSLSRIHITYCIQ